MKNTLETRLGIFFALALIAGAVLLEMAGGADFFKKGKQVKALFNNVQDLKPGDPVKMAGVAIGKVETIGFSQGRVEVTFKVTDPQAAVKTDSRITSRSPSAPPAPSPSKMAPSSRARSNPTSAPSWPSSKVSPPVLKM